MAYLFENFMEPCALIERTRTQDSEGGWITSWTQTLTFNAAITEDTSTLAQIAKQEGVSSTHTILTKKENALEFHDIVKRLSDGETFRVTSRKGETGTPDVASFSFSQVKAERWEVSAE